MNIPTFIDRTKAILSSRKRQVATLAALLIAATTFTALAADNNPKDTGQQDAAKNYTNSSKDSQNKMSQTFLNAWQWLWQDKDGRNLSQSTLAVASVDLREQQDGYTVRLNLPNRDLAKVEINLAGDTLHIVAPADGKAGQYEQDIHLEGLAANATPQIERTPKDGLIVVTVPKTKGLIATTPAPNPIVSLDSWDAWDRDVLEHMNRMQWEMDNIFNQAFTPFRGLPEFGGFFNQARFGASFDLQDEGGKYVLRAYLPNRNTNKVNVTVEGQTLKVEASGEDSQKGNDGNIISTHQAQYAQVLTLPGPVQADKMTIDRKDDMLVVTLPKKT